MSSETSISSPISGANATKLSEKEVISISSNDGVILATEDEQFNAQSLDNEKIRLTEAAITIQAAIRSYQVFTCCIYTISFGSYVHYQTFCVEPICTSFSIS